MLTLYSNKNLNIGTILLNIIFKDNLSNHLLILSNYTY